MGHLTLAHFTEFLKSLFFPEMDDRKKNIQRAFDRTCDWLFSTPQYQNWNNRVDLACNYGMLWVKGKPGAGKSVLIKEVARRALKESERLAFGTKISTTASFFFNARGTQQLQKNALGVYRSLLHQVLKKDMVALSHLSRRYMDMKLYQGSVEWHEADLQEFIMLVFATPESRPSILFVDAMDECDDTEVRGLLEFFRDLAKRAYRVGADLRICFSSRHYPNISLAGCLEVVVEEHNRKDILLYIEDQARDDHSIKELKDDIFDKSNGIFLWVVLIVSMLKSSGHDRSLKWLRKKLDEMPTQLGALFHKIFEVASPDQDEAIRLMHIMIYAQDTLRLTDIHLALGFSGSHYPSIEAWHNSLEFLETPQKIHARIIHLSRGMLESEPSSFSVRLDENNVVEVNPRLQLMDSTVSNMEKEVKENLEKTTYQFIHETVREFFLSGEGFKLLGSDTAQAGPGHATLASACVRYLNTTELASLSERLVLPRFRDSEYHFVVYVQSSLLLHVELAEKNGSCLGELITLIQKEKLNQRLTALRSRDLALSKGADMFFIAAERSMVHTLKRMISLGFDVNQPCPAARRYPLLATTGGRLVEKATDSEYGLEAVRIILAAGADISMTAVDGQTALHLAAAKKSPDVIKLILSYGPDINARDRYHATPLHNAAARTWEKDIIPDVIKLLVQHGADLNAVDKSGDTALHKAGLVQNSAAFSTLVELGADLSIRNKRNAVALDDSTTRGKWILRDEFKSGTGDDSYEDA